MHRGGLRRIAAATALGLAMTMAASDVPALGVGLPAPLSVSADPALGAGPAIASTPTIPSTSVLPPAPQILPPTTLPPAPPPLAAPPQQGSVAAPPGPLGGQSAASPGSKPHIASTRGRVLGRTRSAGEPGSGGRPKEASEVRSYTDREHRVRDRARRRAIRPDSPGFRLFHPSQLARLGEIVGQDTLPSARFLGGYSGSATRIASWAPQLLTIMLLIGFGGFLKAARFPRRRRS
jgi:hypothetical protein